MAPSNRALEPFSAHWKFFRIFYQKWSSKRAKFTIHIGTYNRDNHLSSEQLNEKNFFWQTHLFWYYFKMAHTKLIKIKKEWHRFFCFETATNFLRKNGNIQVWYIQPRGSVWVNTNWESFGRIIIQRNYGGWTWKFNLIFFSSFFILHF